MDKHYGDFFEYSKKILLLSESEYDFLNFDAIFSDETENYRYPCEPTDKDEVSIKIRVWKDNLKNDDRVIIVSNKGEFGASKCDSKGDFDYYKAVLPPMGEKTTYFFKIIKNGRTYYYNKNGIRPYEEHNYDFVILPNFKTPDWAKGAVMYQIYVDRFYNGDKSNDVVNNEYAYMGQAAKQIRSWDQPVANMDICNFYGGDIKGVEEKLDYLCDLGIDVIYFNPIFVSPSNHKYDIQDYDYIDPHYGVIVEDGGEPLYFEKFSNKYATKYMQRTTDRVNLEASNKFFAEFVEKAHKRGIRVILDGVFNHCGAFNKWLDKEGFYHRGKGYPDGAYRTEDSIYHDYFKWFDNDWPNNDCYDAWWGHDNHPKLNFEGSKELYDYILGIGKKWVSAPYNADGWRLDVAADLGRSKEFNHKFWRDFRNAVKEANPDAIILAEHYGDATDW
ncbi:MAG: alpha amylase N-terminal ig-like domain-containing protein, partial [Firmicutes bacterium]|nr:alpha amylase N-terminal ig-like domain-containing protein [Bacillota bacterium]